MWDYAHILTGIMKRKSNFASFEISAIFGVGLIEKSKFCIKVGNLKRIGFKKSQCDNETRAE